MDMKSILIGALSASLLFVSIGAGLNTTENKVGTYQAFARGNDTGGIYMINTMTGDTYHLGVINNPVTWQWRKQTKDDVFK